MGGETSFWAVLNAITWGAGAVACLIVAMWFQRGSERFGLARRSLVLALFLTGAWGLAGILFGTSSHFAGFAESLRNLGWLFALYRLFETDGRHALIKPVRPVLVALAFVELLLAPVHLSLALRGLATPGADFGHATLTVMRLLVSVGGLVLVHNLFGGASALARVLLRWPAMALGAIWAFDLNFYVIAYLTDVAPQMLGMLRGLLGVSTALLLAAGGAHKGEAPRLKPSRSVAFQSISLLLIGGYLALMIVLAHWLSLAGGDYTDLLQIGFVLAASILALLFLPSTRLRGWLRITAAKHLFQHRYDYRTEWLRFTRTIAQGGTTKTGLEERIIRSVADITDSPAGLLLTLGEAGSLELAARWQWPTIEVPPGALDAAAIETIERKAFVADLDEARAGQVAGDLAFALPDWLTHEERAWALVPLLHFERLIGLVVLARPAYSRRLDWEDFDLLRVAGQQLASYLAEHEGQEALAEAERFDDFNRRIAFVMHDIKNLASQFALLASNAERHAENPEFRADMLVTLRNSADKLNALLARLSRYGPGHTSQIERVDSEALIQAVHAQLKDRHPLSVVQESRFDVAANRESLEQVLLHLVQNAIEASPERSPVVIRAGTEGVSGVFQIVDSGTGMSAEFVRSRLFKPFDSTKPDGFGIGAYEARTMIRGMNGRIEVESREGVGTRFIVRLPLAQTVDLINALNASGAHEKKVA